MSRKKNLTLASLALSFGLAAQTAADDLSPIQPKQYTYQTFKDTRVINAPSVEVLQKHLMDFRIVHRFGDLLGPRGGWPSFYGLERVADVYLGLEYGLGHRTTLGFSRTKGAGELSRLLNAQLKYRFLHQTNGEEMPVSLTGVWTTSLSTMTQGPNLPANPSLSDFPKWQHRLVYAYELHLARKFSDQFSLQIGSTAVWRNYTLQGQSNLLLGLNTAGRIQLSKTLGLLFDANFPLASYYWADNTLYFPLALGLEIETGGHVFQLNLSNTEGIMPTDYLLYTRSSWLRGGFRFGFTISRVFRV